LSLCFKTMTTQRPLRLKHRGQFSHFLCSAKVRGGMSEVFESLFRVRPRILHLKGPLQRSGKSDIAAIELFSNFGVVCYLAFARKLLRSLQGPYCAGLSNFITIGQCVAELLRTRLIFPVSNKSISRGCITLTN